MVKLKLYVYNSVDLYLVKEFPTSKYNNPIKSAYEEFESSAFKNKELIIYGDNFEQVMLAHYTKDFERSTN